MNQQIKDELAREAANLEVIASVAEHLPELDGMQNPCICAPLHSIIVTSPFRPDLIQAHNVDLAAAGWRFMREYERTENGNLVREFAFGDAHVSIFYNPHYEGSTCSVKLIGHETTPIYERVCMGAVNGN